MNLRPGAGAAYVGGVLAAIFVSTGQASDSSVADGIIRQLWELAVPEKTRMLFEEKIDYPVLSVVLALWAIVVGVGWYRSNKRREALRNKAATLGFSFDEEATALPRDIMDSLPIFSKGHLSNACNLLWQPGLFVFDYAYVTGRGKNRQEHKQTIVALLDDIALPEFRLCPEHLGHKLMELFGYQDIDFPETPEFSKKILLRGPDETAMRALFSMEVRMLLQGLPGWTVEGNGRWLAIYKYGGNPKPENLQAYIGEACSVAAVFGFKGKA